MRHDFFRLALIGLASTSLLSACADENSTVSAPTVEVTDDGAEIVRGNTLTPPSTDRPEAIAMRFVEQRAGVPQSQLNLLGVTAAHGITHVRLEQIVGGMRVYGAYVKAAVSPKGELLQVIAKVAPNMPATPATVGVDDALSTALALHGYATALPASTSTRGTTTLFAKGTLFHREPSVERVLFADGRAVREAFLVETWSQSNNQLDHTLVDGAGRVLSTERRTNNESYNVFVEDPGKGGQTVVAGGQTPESPAGWLNASLAQRTIAITGNNTRTYLDAQSDNTPDAGGTAVTDGNFLAAADLTQSPSTTGNRAVAVQNLFYLNNVVHDILYRHGFDEAAGNFQTNNFGLGGAGNDAVNAEAQDGGGLDNANFATPADGSAPRMQMYLWSGNTPSGVVTVGASTFGYYASSFGPALTATGTSGALAVANDGSGVTSDACESLAPGSLTGKIAIVDRGTCNFTVKVANAQSAGAVAVIIANNADGNAFGPGGTDRKIKIPSGMVSLADGNTLKGLTGTATVKGNPQPALRVDGDLDSDIVFHEYGHGLTWRMIGGMSGPLAGAIGEGASDTVAFLINGDDRIGEYSYTDALGIRRQPYASYVGGYSTVTGGEVHNDGEVYAAAMYQVLENYAAAGLTATDVLDDFVDGMNFTPATPAFEDMRDGMLQSIAARGLSAERSCLVWRAFAQYEIGVGADGRTAKGGRSVVVTPSTALPPGC